MNLSLIRGVVMDMDGVLWRGDEILPGVAAFFDFLRSRSLPFVLASNNSSKTPADYVAKLSGMGVGGVGDHQVVTSGTTTVDYLQTHYPADEAIHVLGGDGLKALVSGAGFVLSNEAKIVVVGVDFGLTYDKLKRATFLLRAGADFIGTNDDATFPVADGLAPGAGSIIAALKTASDRQPMIMGKPNQPMYDAALHVMGTERGATLMIGDRLNTDIQGAQAAGLLGALVLTGVATRDSLVNNPVIPDGVYDNLPALMAEWDAP